MNTNKLATDNSPAAELYRADHSAFGGVIYQSDFDTNSGGRDNFKGSSVARRIISDQKFDEQCRKNIAFRSMKDKKGGTLHA